EEDGDAGGIARHREGDGGRNANQAILVGKTLAERPTHLLDPEGRERVDRLEAHTGGRILEEAEDARQVLELLVAEEHPHDPPAAHAGLRVGEQRDEAHGVAVPERRILAAELDELLRGGLALSGRTLFVLQDLDPLRAGPHPSALP